ncbi:MAG: hypothetical protein ACNA7I_09665 [Candidatus Methanoperedens sp.]
MLLCAYRDVCFHPIFIIKFICTTRTAIASISYPDTNIRELVPAGNGKDIYDFEAARAAGTGEIPEPVIAARKYEDYWPSEPWIGVLTGAKPDANE